MDLTIDRYTMTKHIQHKVYNKLVPIDNVNNSRYPNDYQNGIMTNSFECFLLIIYS